MHWMFRRHYVSGHARLLGQSGAQRQVSWGDQDGHEGGSLKSRWKIESGPACTVQCKSVILRSWLEGLEGQTDRQLTQCNSISRTGIDAPTSQATVLNIASGPETAARATESMG